MDLDDLKKNGGIVPVAPVEKEVTWTRTDDSGEEVSDTFTIHVRRRSYGSIEKIITAGLSDSERSRSAMFISESLLLGEDGCQQISYEDAYQLHPTLAAVFVNAINEVNGLGRAEPKKSQPPMSSGTNLSSTESAAEQ